MFAFISYSHIDKKFVNSIIKYLTENGIEYFIDEKDIEWGEDVTEEVCKAIAKTTHLIVVISPASLKSNWVAYEVGMAEGKGIKVLPFLTHPSLELPIYLRKLKYITSIDSFEKYLKNVTRNELPVKIRLLYGHVLGKYSGVDRCLKR